MPSSPDPSPAPLPSIPPRFKGRTAVVTGAARGIGRAIAVRLAQEGTDRVRLSGARGEPAPPVVAVVGMGRAEGELRPRRVARPLPRTRPPRRTTGHPQSSW